jgi:hypothetical protein
MWLLRVQLLQYRFPINIRECLSTPHLSQQRESHCEKFRALSSVFSNFNQSAIRITTYAARNSFETIVELVFFPDESFLIQYRLADNYL